MVQQVALLRAWHVQGNLVNAEVQRDCAVLILHKNSAEVDIAPAFGEITTACNVRGQAKKGHGACLKSGQLVYARFHTHNHRCCREMYFNSRLQECVKDKY